MILIENYRKYSPSQTDPSELKKANLPGTLLPHVLYIALARVSINSLDVINPKNTKLRWEFVGVSLLCKSINSKGAEIQRKSRFDKRTCDSC